MRAQLYSFAAIVFGCSCLTALLLVGTPRIEPGRCGFSNRFQYFFGRSLVTIGFWAALFWFLSGLGSGRGR